MSTITFRNKNILLTWLSLLLVLAALVIVRPGAVSAVAKCAILGQGAVACPTDKDGKATLGGGTDNCYYFDPGDPRNGEDPNYPGWRKTSCDSAVYKQATLDVTNPGYKKDAAYNCGSAAQCNLLDTVNLFVNALAALVGIVVIISIVAGGIQYASSGDDPQKVNKAKSRITAAIVALLSFLLHANYYHMLILVLKPIENTSGDQPLQQLVIFAQSKCSSEFFFLPTWYKYLNLDPGTCAVVSFQVPGDFLLVFLAVLDILMRLIGLISVGYVVWGGIQYITSQGEPDRAKTALGTIINAFIGLGIAVMASVTVAFIGNKLG